MKNTIKSIAGLLVFALSLSSCSSEGEENLQLTALDQELKLDNNGVLEVASKTYIFQNTGETVKFENANLEFEFRYSEELNFKTEKVEAKHPGETVRISNPDTEEYMEFSHLEELNSGKFRFDVTLSNGQSFRNVLYNPKKEYNKFHIGGPYFEVSSPLVESIVEMSQSELSTDCRAAVDLCAKTGGRPAVTIKKNIEWFTVPHTCLVNCN